MSGLLLVLMLASPPVSDTDTAQKKKSGIIALEIDPAYCDPNAPANCAYPLGKGDAAPFVGTLLTPSLAIDLGQKADNCDRAKILQLERDVDDAELDDQGCEARYAEQSQAVQKMGMIAQNAADACQKQLDALSPPFYKQPWFVGIVSAVVAGGVVGYVTTR